MTGITFKVYVATATIRSITMMVRRSDGEGAKNVLSWGKRPAGQSRVRTREIR